MFANFSLKILFTVRRVKKHEFWIRAKFHWNRNIQTSMMDLTAVDVSLGEIKEHQGQRICMYFRVKRAKGAKASSTSRY